MLVKFFSEIVNWYIFLGLSYFGILMFFLGIFFLIFPNILKKRLNFTRLKSFWFFGLSVVAILIAQLLIPEGFP
ncbi:hypothetical protein EC844_111102 [Acinetobacter calcoaceticus]|uniref:Uncharacterized protein n=1 Tax=Acinetobacter calcoaceticus TaxID=471 RepID=A0A4R1XU75_ACICA|nr:hypothetical protein EC844_111102 [Acinetobacter calcoaceticus]